jgi:alpha-tubulin suppressor-like RCC1 family protein
MSTESVARAKPLVVMALLVLLAEALAGATPAPAVAADPPAQTADAIAYHVLAVNVGSFHTCAIRADGTLGCWGDGDTIPPVGTFTAVDADGDCAIRTDGTLACWGRDAATPPAGTFSAVSGTCAIRTDGTLACWGREAATPPAGTFSAVSGACAIRTDGTLACWGVDGFYDPVTPPTGTFTALSGGCAIRTDGTLACWGDNTWADPMPQPPTGNFSAIDVADDGTCAIRTDGTLVCWDMGFEQESTPLAGTFAALSVGSSGACAIRTDGTLACWDGSAPRPGAAMTATLPAWLSTTRVALRWHGWPAFAAVTSYDVRYRRTRWDGVGSWVLWLSQASATAATFSASPGYTYCFTVRARDADGLVSDWTGEECTAVPLDDRSFTRTGSWTAGTGSAYYRSTYLRTSTNGATLTTPRLTAYWVALRATTCPTCGTVRLNWGSSLLKTISLYSPARVESRFIPVLAPAGYEEELPAQGRLAIRVVSSGKEVTIDGVLATEMGTPAWADGNDPPTPATYRSTRHVLAVSAGQHHTCAIRIDGTLACWGDNSYGQATPPAGTFSAVSAGDSRTCAIRTDGTLACWGEMSGVDEDFGDPWELTVPSGTFSAVSDGCAIRTDGTLACLSSSEDYSPLGGTFSAVSGACAVRTDGTLACWGSEATLPAGTFTAISAGPHHACAIRTDGTLACWGTDDYYQYVKEYGQATPPAGTFSAVSSGSLHTCAIRTDGTLACWGDNEYFESTPPSGTFTAVDARHRHSCATATDGTLACWGQNWSGQVTPRPTAALNALPTWLATTAIPLHWSATSLAPVTSYDVRYRRAAWNGDFGPAVTWLRATADTGATFAGSPGSTYCFGVRARDADGGASPWTAAGKCTAVPLDDRSLSRSSGWTAGTGSSYYRSTYLRSATAGAKLTRTGVVARRIALLATTCPTCGTAKVYWGSTLLKTISLHSDTIINRKLIAVKTFDYARTGTLSIKVSSSGKKVIIDGVAIRRN